ncbi:MAG TPA: LysM domain-containing protein [Candidatus Limnocylindrales bacterium]
MYDDPAATELPLSTGQSDVQAGAGSTGIGRPAAVGENRSPNAWVCPFLRASDEGDALGLPVEAPDPANRCAALHDPVPQSLRQQELVCLTSGHVNCPRYLRGSIGATERVERTRGTRMRGTRMRGTRTVTPATAGALATFALAFLVSVGFVIANGGLVLTAASVPSPSGGVLGDVETAAPTPAPTVAPAPTAAPTPLVTPSPSPSPSATPSPTPAPTPKPTPRPTSGRFALLTPCPSTPDCYVYVIRSGDNLFSIANYFGVSLTRVQKMNPWVNGGLVVGRGLRIPTPTR